MKLPSVAWSLQIARGNYLRVNLLPVNAWSTPPWYNASRVKELETAQRMNLLSKMVRQPAHRRSSGPLGVLPFRFLSTFNFDAPIKSH